ncbi:helix-turn-helix domain-containing protein [Streptomyces sp. NPDC088253]|uniref:helix-turn-helix domain-containing protein n=2 Tax=unclassified Streptomyces TaxID=2593676 RepID=UPI0037FB36C8
MATIEIMTTGRIELGPNGRTVAANVKRLRAAQGMSLRALSDALSKVGRSLSQDAINKIENGSEKDTKKQIRRVDVDDLIALSVVFRVSPSALLLPLDDSPTGTIEITGVGEVSGNAAWDWADGRRPLKVERGDYDALLEYDLYSRPPRRRSSWKAVQGLLPEGASGEVVEELRHQESGDG